MPSPPKIHLPKTFIMVTTSVEQGLLMPPTKVTNTILRACLAHAQEMHPVKVTDMVYMTTHGHMGMLVDDPLDIKGFMERFKTESAHAINKTVGRTKRTVWCEGYDSPVVLTLEKAIEKMAYFYTNPADAGLVNSIGEYPGLSSWEALLSGESEVRWDCPRLRRFMIPYLGTKKYSAKQLEHFARKMCERSEESGVFTLRPMAWLDAFGVTGKEEREECRQRLIRRVRELEEELALERKRDGKQVIGAKRLCTQAIDTQYLPERKGKRMWCIADTPEQRREFIDLMKKKLAVAREVLKKWRNGDFSLPYPPGFYPPGFPRRVEPLPYTYGMAVSTATS